MKVDCLIIDDEVSITKAIAEYFDMFDLKTACATNLNESLIFLKENDVSLVLLDVNLGTESGFLLCKKIREFSDLPILFISARGSDQDILTALNIGGDDYITKPFTLNILLAKVRNMLARYRIYQERAIEVGGLRNVPSVVTCREGLEEGSFYVDEARREIRVHGTPMKLKEQEYKVMLYLLENRNRVISKEEFFDRVWGDRFIGEGTLSVHIRNIRKQLELMEVSPECIKTIWGVGYLFEETDL